MGNKGKQERTGKPQQGEEEGSGFRLLAGPTTGQDCYDDLCSSRKMVVIEGIPRSARPARHGGRTSVVLHERQVAGAPRRKTFFLAISIILLLPSAIDWDHLWSNEEL
ncbi:MAG: hypothetical protein HQ578_00710 [Chloroflexi bacterium]|nr:hypothetical protein [Chloroflexota bacterium]